jgi:bifunctional pyridoxal-dependent enzyme with beta-cystathionase and maltose regulon repressor activities
LKLCFGRVWQKDAVPLLHNTKEEHKVNLIGDTVWFGVVLLNVDQLDGSPQGGQALICSSSNFHGVSTPTMASFNLMSVLTEQTLEMVFCWVGIVAGVC